MPQPELARQLEKHFSRREWEHLSRSATYQGLIHNNSVEAFDILVQAGELLLREGLELGL